MSSTDLPYFCYTCQIRIQPITEEVICPVCRQGFVVENSQRTEGEGNEQQQEPQNRNLSASVTTAAANQQLHSFIESRFRNSVSGNHGPSGLDRFISFELGNAGPVNFAAGRGRGQIGVTRSLESDDVVSDRQPEFEMINDILSRVFGASVLGSAEDPLIAQSAGGLPQWRISNELHGNPQDYAWGPNGFDNIISELLGHLDNVGAPPATDESIQELPVVNIQRSQVDNQAECSVCMEAFLVDATAKKLPCNHLFHPECIDTWLQLHNTCPICRKEVGIPNPAAQGAGGPSSVTRIQMEPRVNLQRLTPRQLHTAGGSAGSSTAPATTSSFTLGTIFTDIQPSPVQQTTSSSNLQSSDDPQNTNQQPRSSQRAPNNSSSHNNNSRVNFSNYFFPFFTPQRPNNNNNDNNNNNSSTRRRRGGNNEGQ